MMLTIDGINISQLPYERLELANELLSFEDMPILEHFISSNKEDIISYLVDYNETTQRKLYAKVSKKELFSYLIGNRSLKDILSGLESDFIFFIDTDNLDKIISCKLLSKHLIPTLYFPNDESRFIGGVNDYYLGYLKEDYYLYRLKENAIIIKVEPSDSIHRNTVGAKEASIVLSHATSSMEGYVKARAFNILKNDFGNASKINKRVNRAKEALTPRIADAAFGSFEVWISIDTLVFHGQDQFDTQIKNELIEDYKKDVLNIDFSNEDDAKIISEKFTEDERKMIYEPILRLLENENINVFVSDNKNTIRRKGAIGRPSIAFKNLILPPPTIDEVQQELNRKNKIVSIVLNLKEGTDFAKINKKELMDNLLFSQEIAETEYEIQPSFSINGRNIILKQSIKCVLSIDESGNLQLYNNELEISAEGTDIHELVKSVQLQFLSLLDNIKGIIENDYPKAKLIDSYYSVGLDKINS